MDLVEQEIADWAKRRIVYADRLIAMPAGITGVGMHGGDGTVRVAVGKVVYRLSVTVERL